MILQSYYLEIQQDDAVVIGNVDVDNECRRQQAKIPGSKGSMWYEQRTGSELKQACTLMHGNVFRYQVSHQVSHSEAAIESF